MNSFSARAYISIIPVEYITDSNGKTYPVIDSEIQGIISGKAIINLPPTGVRQKVVINNTHVYEWLYDLITIPTGYTLNFLAIKVLDGFGSVKIGAIEGNYFTFLNRDNNILVLYKMGYQQTIPNLYIESAQCKFLIYALMYPGEPLYDRV